jgi:hypothetical protein
MNALILIGIWVGGVASSILDIQPTGNIFSSNISITAALGPNLSPNAAIILPDQADWRNASARWQGYAIPTYQAVVEVATEKDIQQTVIGIADRVLLKNELTRSRFYSPTIILSLLLQSAAAMASLPRWAG